MILTNDDEVRDVAWSFRDHGRNRERTISNDHPFGFRWLQDRIGTNARMTEMQAAIGRCQLKKVEGWIAQRTINAGILTDFLNEIEDVRVPTPSSTTLHAYYRLSAIFDCGEQRNRVVQSLQSSGVPAAVGPCPEIYLEDAIVSLGIAPKERCPVANELGNKSMVLSVHPGIEVAMPKILDQIAMVFG